MKDPPDKYRTIKCAIKSIIKKENYTLILFDAVCRTHKLVIQCYQFLRLWILDIYNKNKNISEITEDTIKMAFKTLATKSVGGPKPQGDNAKLLDEFNQFYETNYQDVNYQKISSLNLSQILGYMTTDMLTNIENNIKLNFISYVKRFVNSSFKKEHNEIIEKAEKNKYIIKKELKAELYKVKEDLINNTLKSDEKYHGWIKKHKINIFPTEYKDTYLFDIQNNPQKYLKGMIYMCQELEKNETKMFQFFPLRNQSVPKYISIDSKSLVELFIEKDKNEYLSNIETYKNELWSKIFKLDNKIFRQTNYKFDYRISTDCMAVSIQLLNKKYIDQENKKKENMKNKKAELKEDCKDMSKEEKEEYKKKLEIDKKEKEENKKLELKQKKNKEKEDFKKLPKEEKKKIIEDKKKNKIIKQSEFPYLEDLYDEQIEEMKTQNKIYLDPGKRSLFYMMDDNGSYLNYTNKKYMKGIKRLEYQNLLSDYKKSLRIDTMENELSSYNSKSCNFEKFKNFIKKKNELLGDLIHRYKDEKFRRYKWYAYINKKRTEDNLINEIKKKFNDTKIIVFGDWGIGKQMKNFISTPNLGLKRKLNEHFKVYSIDEFRTSQLNYKTEEICENLVLSDKKGVKREMHSILTFKMENNRLGCINRDKNSINNMKKLTDYFLKYKDRPEKYKRTTKLK